MATQDPATIAEWLATRPPTIQALAQEFPYASHIHHGADLWYVCGWWEEGGVSLSPIDPTQDYDGAMATRRAVNVRTVRAIQACGEHHA